MSKLVLGNILHSLFLALCLFLAAGTITWIAAWIFLILFYSFSIALDRMLLKHNTQLMEERAAMFRSDQQSWDKAFVLLFYILFVAWLAIMPLDAVRFRWSQMPSWLNIVGGLVLTWGLILRHLTFRENSYLSPMVRVQSERGHRIVSTGPYRHVRHPLYASSLLFISGTALLLGSYYGLILFVAFIVMFSVRALLEERMLRKELQGYDSYMLQVKYRLIPHVW